MSRNNHPILAGFCFVFLFIFSIIFTCLLIFQTTIMQESYTEKVLKESKVVEFEVNSKLSSMLAPASALGVDTKELAEKVKQPVAESLNTLVLGLIYHPKDSNEQFKKMQSDVTAEMIKIISNNNSSVTSIVENPIKQVVVNSTQSIKQAIHYDELVSFGNYLDSIKMPVIISLIASGILSVLCTICLFVLNKKGLAVAAFIISGLFTGLVCAAGLLIKVGSSGALTQAMSAFQKNISMQFGIAAACLIGLAIILGVISYITGRRRY